MAIFFEDSFESPCNTQQLGQFTGEACNLTGSSGGVNPPQNMSISTTFAHTGTQSLKFHYVGEDSGGFADRNFGQSTNHLFIRSITPATNDDNWTLDAASNELARIIEVRWSGEATSSTAMMTRTARSSGAAGSGTAGNVAKMHRLAGGTTAADNYVSFFTTYATTQPTLDAGDLVSDSWNAHGGIFRWLASPGEEIYMVGAETVSNRNAVGTAVSSYSCIWEEE